MFISDPRPSQEEADEMVWHNNLLETPAVTATTGFPPPSHNGLDHDWNKSVNLEDFCQTAHANDNATASPLHHIHHNPQFDPSSSHLDMDMDMMTSFNTSFDTMSASSPSVGATWSESSPEYETCRQHEGHGNNNSSSSSSFHRPSTESTNCNDAQSFSPTSDASWGSSPAPQIQGSYMDLSDTTTATTTISITSPNSSSMSAYPGQQQQPQHQQQSTELSQHGLSDASACLGTVETDTLFNNAGASHPQQRQTLSDFVVWTSAPSSSLASASSSFVSHPQAEPRWHQYSVSAEPMLDEPRLSSSSLSLDNMSEGGLSTMPSSPINPFHNGGGGATGHHSLVCDGLPSPTHSSFGRSSANGGVSLQHQHQHQQYPSVMLNGGQLAAAGGVPFDSGNNFSHHPSSSPSSGTIGGGGDILFRGPISHRTVFDYPSSAGPTHTNFDHETNVTLKAEGPLSVSPGSFHVWLNNNHQQQHKTPTPHPSVSPESSPIGANNTFFQHNNQMPLPIDFGGNNAVQFGGSGHINTSQLHPHYAQQVAASNRSTQRKSLPHSPPHRGMGSGGGRPPSPRYNPAVMTTREMLPSSHPNSPSMSMAWAHHQGQGHPHGLPHHHPLMIKPNTIPSHHHQHPHPSLASMSHSHSRRQQPFHHGAHPYHNNHNNNRRRGQGHHQDNNATDHLKRARAEQDALLVRLRKQGKSYKQIRQLGRFTEAESTLRGRYRTLTKSREQRVRKPEWTDKDLRLLERAVRELAKGPLSVTYSNASKNSSSVGSSSSSSTTPVGEAAMSITSLVSTSSKSSTTTASSPSTTSASSPSITTTQSQAQVQSQPQNQKQPQGIPTTTTKIPWKQVSHYIVSHGGSYKFGNATVRKRWEELMRDQLARGKDLQRPFWEQRSKRSPYHSLSLSQSQSQAASSSSGFASRAASTRQAQSQGQGKTAGAEAVGEVKRERDAAAAAAAGQVKSEREEGNEDGNLAYSDWLDMSALGDDADENHNDNEGSNNGTDGDGDYDLSDASDSEEEEEEEDGDADSDDDYMEE